THDYKPAAYFAKEIDVSSRTIYSDLDKIEDYSSDLALNVFIEKKTGVGLLLVGDTEDKMQLLDEIKDEKREHQEGISPQKRRLEIAKILILDEKTITLQKMADKFFVSTSSIAIDLEKINAIYDVRIISSNQGTKIAGTEEEIQRSLFQLALQILKSKNYYEEPAF